VKRLVYEMNIGQRFLAGPLSRDVESVEVLNVLRFDKDDISVICRVRFRDPDSAQCRLFDDDKAEVQELETDKKDGRVLFVRRKLPRPPKGVDPRLVYLSTPWKVQNGVGRITCLGSVGQIRTLLQSLEKAGIACKIVSLTEAKFSPESLLGLLTQKQQNVLAEAFRQGYYDIPRKMRSDELATKLGMRNATFVAHRRKAERRLLAEVLGES